MAWDNGSPLRTVLKWAVAIVVGIAAFKLLLWSLRTAFAVGTFLLFTVVPVVIVGWLTVKFLGYLRR